MVVVPKPNRGLSTVLSQHEIVELEEHFTFILVMCCGIRHQHNICLKKKNISHSLICALTDVLLLFPPFFYWSYFDTPSKVRGQTWVMESIACSDCSVDLLTWALSTSASGSIAWQVEVTTVSGAPSLTALWGMLHPYKCMPERGP